MNRPHLERIALRESERIESMTHRVFQQEIQRLTLHLAPFRSWFCNDWNNELRSYCNPFLKFKTPFYISDTNNIISLPLLSTIRYYVFSHDVIHSSGIYSSGIKIDATPGRLNFTSTIRTLIKGEHRGFRYEPRGLGHSPTLTIGPVLLIMPIIFIIRRNESIGSVGKKSHAIFDVVKNRNHFLVVKN